MLAILSERRVPEPVRTPFRPRERRPPVNSIIYLIGLIVVVLAILSFLGLR